MMMATGLDIMWVGIGGGTGALLRWGLGILISKYYKGNFPIATFIVNISGAFIIAYLSVLLSVDWNNRYGTPVNDILLTGMLGGYTTFSSMQADTLRLAHEGKPMLAVFYMIVSVSVGLLAAALGVALASV